MSIVSKSEIGSKFGSLTLVGEKFQKAGGGKGTLVSFAEYLCVCGTRTVKRWGDVSFGRTTSCGCIQSQRSRESRLTHGASKTDLHRVWCSMKGRCQRPTDKGFKFYGGRGITVCIEWQEYEPFQSWALDNGYSKGLQLDRKDNALGYSPENCHFVTSKENCRNTRRNHLLVAFGETKSIAAWADDPRCCVTGKTLNARANKKTRTETDEEIITRPMRITSRTRI